MSTDKTTILGISGSLRSDSYNTALLRSAQALAGDNVRFDIATLHGIPLYDGDVEAASGIPNEVVALKERIVACDGLLLATPEYNNNIPGVFKNAIDWLSRPPSDIGRVFGGRAVAVIGASPGPFGTALAQNAWRMLLGTLRTRPWYGDRLIVPGAGKVFDKDGQLTDDALRDRLAAYVSGFAGFAAS